MSPYNTGSSLELVAFFMLELLNVIYFHLKWLNKQNEQTKKSENGKVQGLEVERKTLKIFQKAWGTIPEGNF